MRHANYDAIAATYDRRYTEDDYSGVLRALLAFIGSASARVLEVGCGTGHWLQVLGARPLRPLGVDPSVPMLSQARAKLGNGLLIQGRAESLPLIDMSVDRVFCINAHQHFANKPRFFAEAHRVLRRGGSMMTVALDPHTCADQWWVYDYFEGTLAIDKERYPSCDEIRQCMAAAGFGEVNTSEVQHLPDDIAALDALAIGVVSPEYTSQLAVLTNNEFLAGLEQITSALARDSNLRLTADLRLYATYGRRLGSI